MGKLRLGIICPSDIAARRFLPAVSAIDDIEFVGVAVNSAEERYGSVLPPDDVVEAMLKRGNLKASEMVKTYGGKVFDSCSAIISSPEIDALYIPLPPALHYKWAKIALNNGKHVLVEKPATTTLDNTDDLISTANSKCLALHENYMFVFHDQLKAINEIIYSGELGDVRLYRISFGFPMRAANDFRYNRVLGGGALLDAGGYTIKYASYLLGETARVAYAHLNTGDTFEVDLYGSGALVNDNGMTAQVAFGMDNEYKCELEIWGSKGSLATGRVLTAPAGYVPTARLVKGGKETIIELPADDAFRKSIERFLQCTREKGARENNYKELHRQAELVQSFMNLAGV